MKTVWVYVNTDALPGDVDHLHVFATEEAAQRWFNENDPEKFAFEYPPHGAIQSSRYAVHERAGTGSNTPAVAVATESRLG